MTSVQTPQPDAPMQQLLLRRAELSARYIGVLINAISLIAGIISILVVGSVVFLAWAQKIIPPELANWGGIILGFYFGQFVSLVKDYMGILQTSNAHSTGTSNANGVGKWSQVLFRLISSSGRVWWKNF
jgi:hypothetical protein